MKILKKNSIILLVVSNIITAISCFLVAWFVYGWWGANIFLQTKDMFQGGMAIIHYSNIVSLQRSYGSVTEYRNALVAYNAALDEAKVNFPNSPILTDDIFYTDKTFAYVRLANLESFEGNIAQSKKFQNKAVSMCKKIPWENCEFEHLSEICSSLDNGSKEKSWIYPETIK